MTDFTDSFPHQTTNSPINMDGDHMDTHIPSGLSAISAPHSPIPANEREIPAVTAEKFLDVPDTGGILEGLCFDRKGNMWFVDCPHGAVYHVEMSTKRLTLAFHLPDHAIPCSVKIHRDGRLFLACSSSDQGSGIFVLSTKGKLLDVITVPEGRLVDDLVFSSRGDIYYTDLSGSAADPRSGVWMLTAESGYHTEITVMTGMVASNGIALSPDEKFLWVTEYGRGLIHRLQLNPDGTPMPALGSWVTYHTTGYEGPDSASVDEAGNLYVAMCGQARYLVFSPQGFPVGQVLLPGAEKGERNKSTHPQLRPGTDELYLTGSDTLEDSPTYGHMAIFRTRGLAKAYRSYQFR